MCKRKRGQIIKEKIGRREKKETNKSVKGEKEDRRKAEDEKDKQKK
jgi:hypothetical protein